MVSSDKKSMDVSKPGKSAPDTTARPLIVSNRPVNIDPMMKTRDIPEAQISQHTKVIKPLNSVDIGDAPVQQSTEEAVQDPSTTVTEKSPPKALDKPAESADQNPPSAEEIDSETDTALSTGTKKEKLNAQTKEEKARQEAMQKLIVAKKYFVPIGKVTRRRDSRRTVVVLMVLTVVTIAGIYLLVDAGIISIGIKLPIDIIKN